MGTKINRLNEIEKIADRLGIGKDRDVECLGCKKTFRFKDAVILTDGNESKHLCKDCYQKLLAGKLNDNQEELLEKLKELQREIRDKNVQPVPYIPDPPIRWEPSTGTYPPYKVGDYEVSYNISGDIGNINQNMFMALVPKEYADKSS